MYTSITVLAVLVLATGCGSTRPAQPSPPRTVRLNWHETYTSHGERLVFVVRRLRIGRGGWSVDASVTNGTRTPLTIERAHRPGQTLFGLLVLRTRDVGAVARTGQFREPLQTTRFVPSLPRLLEPGASWSGTFSGPGTLARRRYVRIEFGRFWTNATGPAARWRGFIWITNHALHV